jgi:hypothetical protein
MDMPNSSNGVSPPSLPLSKQPTHRFILPTHLRLDIKLRKLLFISRPKIIVAWITRTSTCVSSRALISLAVLRQCTGSWVSTPAAEGSLGISERSSYVLIVFMLLALRWMEGACKSCVSLVVMRLEMM